MSRTLKDVPRMVRARRGERGWCVHWYAWGTWCRAYPENPAYCGCGRGHSPGRCGLRFYWSRVRRNVKQALAAGHEPEPTRPRNGLRYNYH